MKQSNYTKPKVCKAAKGWYVYFYYNGKQYRYKKGINYIKNVYNREIEANALSEALHIKLKNKWNPGVPEIVKTSNDLSFIDALDFSLSKKKDHIASKTYSGYKGSINFMKTAVTYLGLDLLNISELKRVHIRTILEKAKNQRKWTNKAYNKHLNHLKAILTELVQWDVLEYNPAHNIKKLKVSESRSNIPANDIQHEKIKNCLENEHPYFYSFIQTIFHSGIRPKEILGIQISMIDLNKQIITLPAINTKTNTFRVVPINNHLLQILCAMELHTYPKSFYLFGSYRESGRGNVGKFIDFIPGPTRLKRDTATKRWHKIIKTGLDINVNMYSYKHKGGDDKIKAGVSLDALRNLYGHKNSRMTEIYAKEIKNVYKDEIINKSPKF